MKAMRIFSSSIFQMTRMGSAATEVRGVDGSTERCGIASGDDTGKAARCCGMSSKVWHNDVSANFDIVASHVIVTEQALIIKGYKKGFVS
jgi:hypothetical protein